MPENFQDYLEGRAEEEDSYARRYLRKGKNPLELVLEEARGYLAKYEKEGDSEKANKYRILIEKVENKGMLDGSFEITYEGAKRIYDSIKRKLGKSGEASNQDLLSWMDHFDEIRDHDLIATGIFCLVPEIRDTVGEENLYKVVLYAGAQKQKGYSTGAKQNIKPNVDYVFPSSLINLIASLPIPKNDVEVEQQRKLKLLLKKKAERDLFPVFKNDKDSAFRQLEERIEEETDENLREVYTSLRDTYKGYEDLEAISVNPNFIDSDTGEKGVLPSLHQKIGMYHLLREKKFGIFDGCGTGKTAIAVLTQPLIEQAMKKEGKEFRRTVVLCPNPAKKAWKKGLTGNDNERYLVDPQDIAVINGGVKSKEFIEDLKNKKWIVLNYEQAITKVSGTGRLLVEELVDMGIDYLIEDEAHHVKGHRDVTANGKPTISAAARLLSHSAEYSALLTGSPIPNSLEDYATLFSMLNPEICPHPSQFKELYHGNPRILYTFFNEKTIRRNSEDINEDLEIEPFEDFVELTNEQRQLYEHIVEFRPKNWLIQARKALIDPRLVDPEILERVGLLGKVNSESSAKYQKLEELLSNEEGPLRNNEKFVIFSSMFREGITQPGHPELERRYSELGHEKEFEELGLHVSLAERLENELGIRIGVIDGTIIDIEERERIVARLGEDLDGILCTTDTGGESLDFTEASYAYFLDRDYTPTPEEQGVHRLLRKGQTKTVRVHHLKAEDTLEEDLDDYVTKKVIINKIASDGYPLTKEEERLLEDTSGKQFGELVKRGLGGKSIDVLQADVDSIEDFSVKKRNRNGTKKGYNPIIDYNTTEAQEIMRWIGKDRFGCWKDPEFVELYMKALNSLSVPIVHRAKVCDFIARASRGSIDFPGRILAEGSGPSLLYNTYQALAHLVERNGFNVPNIVDRDSSQLMLDRGNNPDQILGNMTGENSKFKNGSFDMVDNESITLLRNSQEVKDSLLEANRILKPNGLIELVTQNWRFSDGFYSGMENLGFELLTEKDQGFAVSKEMLRRLKEDFGEHYAQAYANKLANTYVLLARKQDNPADVKHEELWFVPEVEEKIEENSAKVVMTPINGETEAKKYLKPKTRRRALPGEISGLRKDLEGNAEIEE